MRTLLALLCLIAGGAAAQDRTMATYGDWQLRCETAPSRNCEAATVLSAPDNRPMAQLIIGRLNSQGPTLLLAHIGSMNVHLPAQVRLNLASGGALAMAYQRCTTQGCFASVELDDATLARLRAEPAGAQMVLQDSGRREIALPLSFRGFGQAQAALSQRR